MANPLNPLAFFSYVHSGGVSPTGRPQAPDSHIAELYDLVCDHLTQLVPRTPGAEPAFIDRRISPGITWSEELLNALGSCHVFVALLSPPYLHSDWCGKEWFAFSAREVVGPAASSAIIPVLWAPLEGVRIPPMVDKVQRFMPDALPDPTIAELYRNEGLYGLMATGQEDAYQMVIWRLARRIAATAQTHRVAPQILKEADLRDIFREET